MKRILCAVFAFTIVLSLFSCQRKKTDVPDSSGMEPVSGMNEISSDAPTDPPTDPELISSLAIKNLMDVENYSWEREYPVEYVMIHFCSDVVSNRKYPYSINAIRRTFEQNEVSINYIIARNGEIQCWIPEQRAAWHAGKGEWKDDPKYTNLMNKYSIGIELMAIGSKNDMKPFISSSSYNSIDKYNIGFTSQQYESLIALLKDICQRWNIPKDRDHIIGHEDYSPGRKTDPGDLFSWDKVITGINAE